MGFSFRDFFNKVSNDNRIFTSEDIKEMSTKEFIKNEKAIDYQMINLGIPKNSELLGRDDVVFVNEYMRGDGTVVRAHFRSKPGSLMSFLGMIAENARGDNVPVSNYFSFNLGDNFLKIGNEYYNGIKHNYPVTKELANIFLSRPENMPKSSEYTYIPPGFGSKLNDVFDLTNIKEIPNNWSGIIYNENSLISKSTSNSFDVQNAVRNAYNTQSHEFKSSIINFEINKNNPNLRLAIGHATILNPQIENGYFEGILFDKYDFDLTDKNLDSWLAYVNNVFWFKQLGRRFYILAPVKFKW